MAYTKEVAGELIRDIRRRSGLRQAELARRAGLPRSVVSAYEHGRRQPGVDALARLAAAAGMELRVDSIPRWIRTAPGESLPRCSISPSRCLHVGAERLEYPSLRHLAWMSLLGQRLLEIHDALSDAGLPHAFGGAIALAYCTQEPRGTRDLDVNVFIDPARAGEVFAALPDAVTVTDAERRDGRT